MGKEASAHNLPRPALAQEGHKPATFDSPLLVNPAQPNWPFACLLIAEVEGYIKSPHHTP